MNVTDTAIAQIADYVIKPALDCLAVAAPGINSRASLLLVLATGAHESSGYTYLAQVGGGPALGWFQMEPATEKDIWTNWLRYNDGLLKVVKTLSLETGKYPEWELIHSPLYAAAMCRLSYFRQSFTLPDTEPTPLALAKLWKTWYNTPSGAGTIQQFLASHEKYVATYQANTSR